MLDSDNYYDSHDYNQEHIELWTLLRRHSLAFCILNCSNGHFDQKHPYLQETIDEKTNFKPNTAVLTTTEQKLEEGQV